MPAVTCATGRPPLEAVRRGTFCAASTDAVHRRHTPGALRNHRADWRRRHGRGLRAHDTRLDRTVAIKVLPSTWSASERAPRFAREARAIAALSHPHICTLFDVGHHEGADYLVMEYPGGRVARRPAPPGTVCPSIRRCRSRSKSPMRCPPRTRGHRPPRPEAGQHHPDEDGRQAARLRSREAAHAKPVEASSTWPPSSRHHRRRRHGRHAAVHVAGAGRGREADARSDIFALGASSTKCSRADGRSKAIAEPALMAAILYADPPARRQSCRRSQPAFDYFVRSCLAKNPDDRWHRAHDVLLELRWLEQERPGRGQPPEPAAADEAGLIAALALRLRSWRSLPWWRPLRSAPAAPAGHASRVRRGAARGARVRLARLAGGLTRAANSWCSRRACRGDGSCGCARSMARSQPMPDTEGATFAFWSPDSRRVAFVAGGKLKRWTSRGGR